MKRTLCLFALATFPCLGTLASEDPDAFWSFYEKYPHMQDFFPFGMYGGDTGEWSQFGHDPRGMNELRLDLMAANGLNALWSPSYHRTVRSFERDGKPATELTDYGRWWYGEALPAYGFKTLPSLIHVFTRPAFYTDYARHDPPLSQAELDAVATRWEGVLDAAKSLAETYPETIFAFVSDDEPRHLAAMAASQKLIADATGRAVTTCIPGWGQSQVFLRHMQPFTGDWYVTGDLSRNNWAIARQLDWMRENAPERIFWFVQSACSGRSAATKPWLLNSQVQPVDLRMQFWMAIAGGCKGFYYYHLLYGVTFAAGEDNLLSAAHLPKNDLWPEIGRLAATITSAGPLLIPCRPDAGFDLRIDCGRVRYAEYAGPAVTVGLLRDIHRDRFYLVPYSNDLYDRQRATVILPPELSGRQILDLATLDPVPSDGKHLELELGPGHGRLLLLSDAAELAEAKATVLRHRAEQARRHAAIAMRRSRPADAAALETAATAAAAAGNWQLAIATWDALKTSADKAFATGPTARLAAAGPVLDEIARMLTETDNLFLCHRTILEIEEGQALIWGIRGHGTKYAATEVGDWMAYLNLYLSLRLRYRAGENMSSSIHNTALTLRDRVTANREAVQGLIDQRLAEVRHPLRVACITGDRRTIEYHAAISWLYERFSIRWFAPDAAGRLVDPEGRVFAPKEFDAVWISQLRYMEPPADGEPVEPAKVLVPALVTSEMLAAMQAYLRDGGGLVLQGLAGLYAVPLGLETTLPDRLQENAWYGSAFSVGVAAAPGFAEHPLLAGLDAGGFLSNGTFPEQNLVPECAWQARKPTGTVIAVEHDEMFGAIGDYAAVVEYALDNGRVLVLGGRGLDLTPGRVKGVLPNCSVSQIRRVHENAIVYAGGEARFIPAEVQAPGDTATERHFLPENDWSFRLDPDNQGIEDTWFASKLATKEWGAIRIGLNWEAQGYDYNGYAWYRRSVPLRNKTGKRTLLHFGAVDEQAIVWIDGQEVGRHEEGPTGWDQPFRIDITDAITDENAEPVVVVRVQDDQSAGGIWKPVWIEWK